MQTPGFTENKPKINDPNICDLEKQIKVKLGAKVAINIAKKEKVKLLFITIISMNLTKFGSLIKIK